VRPSLRWSSSTLYIRFGGDGQIQRRPEAWRHSRSTSLYMCGGTGGVGEGVSRDTVQARQWSQRRCYTGEVLVVESDHHCTNCCRRVIKERRQRERRIRGGGNRWRRLPHLGFLSLAGFSFFPLSPFFLPPRGHHTFN
jgi:hypothetical protein